MRRINLYKKGNGEMNNRYTILVGVSGRKAAKTVENQLSALPSWSHFVSDVSIYYIHDELKKGEPVKWVAFEFGCDDEYDMLSIREEIEENCAFNESARYFERTNISGHLVEF